MDVDVDVKEEAEVLNWLLEDKEVAKAIDCYLQGGGNSEAAAVPLLLRAVDRLCPPPSTRRRPPPQGEQVLARPQAGQQNAAERQPESDCRKRARIVPPAAAPDSIAVAADAVAASSGATPGATPAIAAASAAAEGLAAQRPRPSQVTGGQGEGDDWLAQCQQALDVERVKDKARLDEKRREAADEEREEQKTAKWSGPRPLYWKLDLPGISKTLTQKGLLPAGLVPAENPHTTLLYFGGTSADDVAAKRSGISLDQFRGMREALEAFEGEEFEVRILRIIVEDSVACAVVSLPPVLPCCNKVPHVTLGTKPGVAPRYANEVLEELQAGRKEGINVIELPNPRPLRGRVMLEYSKTDAA